MNHNITQVTERAIRAFIYKNLEILDWLPETQLYRGIENRDTEAMEGEESSLRAYPCITCVCRSATPLVPFRGVWTCHVELWIEEVARDTTGDEHDAKAAQVFDMFMDFGIAGNIIAAFAPEPYHVTQVNVTGDLETTVEDARFKTVLRLDFAGCCAAALT